MAHADGAQRVWRSTALLQKDSVSKTYQVSHVMKASDTTMGTKMEET